MVLRAQNGDDPRRRSALDQLCRTYWRPVYAYLRRKGFSPDDAEDRTQGFFLHFLEKDLVDRAHRARGRFKSYLLATLEHYLANEARLAGALKRGGGRPTISINRAEAEVELRIEPFHRETPESAFERSWTLTLLENTFAALKREFRERGLPGHFDVVRAFLAAGGARPSYEELARRLRCSTGDVTNLLHRARKQLQELIRSGLRDTLEEEQEIDAEIRYFSRSL